MKILVKTSKGLRNIGEGRIYSKKDIRLIGEEFTANLGNPGSLQNAITRARKEINQNPSVNKASTKVSDINHENDGQGEGLNINVPINSDAGTLSVVNGLTNNPNAKNANVTFTKPNTSGSNEGNDINDSKKYSKKLVEMRRNSIPFSKDELNKFLNSL